MGTSTNLANALTKLVAVEALPAVVSNLIVGNLATLDFAPIVSQQGYTVEVPVIRYGKPGSADIVLTHIEASFQIPDVTKVLAVPDLLKLYIDPAVVAIAEKIDTELLRLPFTANEPVGTGGSAITESTVEAADTALFNARVSPGTPKYMVVDVSTYSIMRRMPAFSEYRAAGEAGLRTVIDGAVGKIRDFFVFRSLAVPKTDSDPVTTNNLAFSRQAMCLVTRRLPKPLPDTNDIAEYAELGDFGMRVIMHYRPGTLAQQFTLSVLYGVGVLHSDHGVRVLS